MLRRQPEPLECELMSLHFVLPAQGVFNDNARCAGERKLCFELLAGALHDISSPLPQIHRPALRWLMLGTIGGLSAEDCCDYIGVDYRRLRRAVEAGARIRNRRRNSVTLPPDKVIERSSTRDRRFPLVLVLQAPAPEVAEVAENQEAPSYEPDAS